MIRHARFGAPISGALAAVLMAGILAPTPAGAAKATTFTTESPVLTSKQVGQTLALRVTPSDSGSIDCTTVGLALVGGQKLPVNWYLSGCWRGGVNLVTPITRSMVGKAVRLQGTATGMKRSPAGSSTIGRAKATSQPVVLGQAPVPPRPEPTATKPIAPKPTEPKPTEPKPTAPAKPDAGATPQPGGRIASLQLPRIAWEGGPGYYSRFPDAVRGGWTSPAHFPIAVWWGGASSDAEVRADKALGINTYVVTNPSMDHRLFARNGVSYIGSGVRNQPRSDRAWVGDYLDDEVDGRFAPQPGLAHLKSIANKLPDHRKFRYANFTGMLISWHQNNPAWNKAADSYANSFTDTVSLDTYWYSTGQCSWAQPNGFAYQTPFTKQTCRSPQNYGRTVESMRWRDARDGKLQPVWNFIENVDVAADGTSFHDLTPAEVKAAAISSIIHEARGLIWFNQSFGGKCSTGNALRDAQRPGYACRAQVLAMGEVNRQVQALAPVLNTQSYRWDFGPGLETMLKLHDGSAHIFAMSSDAVHPGRRTFTLPPQLRGRSIEVLGENRTITPAADGTFTDTFASLTSYHVYRIR
ncbi:hypothetical protein AAEX63_13510 [Luteococcus sp. H138]|uniref:hypothetical protein n=1 Tax=unclassified Luteococcus TaxID=2639923 RepID=UPI00313C1F69